MPILFNSNVPSYVNIFVVVCFTFLFPCLLRSFLLHQNASLSIATLNIFFFLLLPSPAFPISFTSSLHLSVSSLPSPSIISHCRLPCLCLRINIISLFHDDSSTIFGSCPAAPFLATDTIFPLGLRGLHQSSASSCHRLSSG